MSLLARMLPVGMAAVYASAGYALGGRLDDAWFAFGAWAVVAISVYGSVLWSAPGREHSESAQDPYSR